MANRNSHPRIPMKAEDDPIWRLGPLRRRETYEGCTRLIGELPIIGRLDLQEAVQDALRPARHLGEYELHLVREGSLEMWIDSTSRTCSIHGGKAVLTQPGQLHGGVQEMLKPARWYWLRFRVPTANQPMPGLSASETRALLKPLTAVVPPVFDYSPALENCFERLLEEHRRPRPDSFIMARAILHELILGITRDYQASRVRPSLDEAGFSAPMRNAIQWLNLHLGDEISVGQMADAAGMSESYFRRFFHSEVGFSPADYVIRKRIERARDLLIHSSRSVTGIAIELGFSTPAYFAAVFRKHTGQTPTEFRQHMELAR
jgi:AraC-like DNA-binding protein